MAESSINVDKFSGIDFPADTNRIEDVEDQVTSAGGLHVGGEVYKSSEAAHNEPCQSEIGDEGAAFELDIEDSKDLLSLNEELSNILDPKVGCSLNLLI